MDLLSRYGIKEVADVTFYKIDEAGDPTDPVLFLDTLKVSTIEQTASTADATGGRGNAKLISWDYGREINVTLEDALFSPKSMAVMYRKDGDVTTNTSDTLLKAINYSLPSSMTESAAKGLKVAKQADGSYAVETGAGALDVTWYKDGVALTTATTTLPKGTNLLGKFSVQAATKTISIDASNFPGTYYIVGDTVARNEVNGEDEFFQFVIYKAKVSAENTITLQAEGDPAVFNLNLTVLRDKKGRMMDLIPYTI